MTLQAVTNLLFKHHFEILRIAKVDKKTIRMNKNKSLKEFIKTKS